MRRFIELNHVIKNGTISYPGMPPVEISALYTREQCGATFGSDAASLLDFVKMVNISGTYIDSPYHKYESGYKISEIPMEKCFDLPTFVVDLTDSVDENGDPWFTKADLQKALEGEDIKGSAVIMRSGHYKKFMTPEYEVKVPYLDPEGATWMMEQGVYVCGIDTQLIDDFNDKTKGDVCHEIILSAGSVIAEDMTNLDELPARGARLYVIAPRIEMASFPARVFAVVEE